MQSITLNSTKYPFCFYYSRIMVAAVKILSRQNPHCPFTHGVNYRGLQAVLRTIKHLVLSTIPAGTAPCSLLQTAHVPTHTFKGEQRALRKYQSRRR
ncbi:MAG: hypothetical protein V2I36_15635, partial [Desulfopila sp.]|nr:hypothetical protein [Desulfopila sp.]